jgi:hypothetical protein
MDPYAEVAAAFDDWNAAPGAAVHAVLARMKETAMRLFLSAAAIAVATSFIVTVSPAHAKTCKDVVTAKARSAAQVSDASRLRRARENAIANWRARARDTYGWAYRFWSRAEERDVQCGGGASAKHCTARARPCRLL